MSCMMIEKEETRLEDGPPIDLPPMEIIKCQCGESPCMFSAPCSRGATEDDLLCDECREFFNWLEKYRQGIFSNLHAMYAAKFMTHCHKCEAEDGDDDAADKARDEDEDQAAD